MALRRRVRSALAPLALGLLSACSTAPIGTDLDRTPPPGTNPGPRVVWDLGAKPFPEIPLPNDVATWPDPTSPTGVRINASLLAPTLFEEQLRRDFAEMDGWGTFMPLSVAFQDDLDLADIARRHPVNSYDFRDDGIYLIDLETGHPIPLDVGQGNFPQTLPNPFGVFPNDPRAGGSNFLLSVTDEDANRDGILQPSEDTNHDGVMQRASIFPAGTRPEDGLTTHWEAESHTLIVRPLIPLQERHRYAVVVTDRLHGLSGGAVRSPFDTIAHPTQLAWLAPLRAHFANGELSSRFYGDLRWGNAPGGSHVAFAWTFLTQTTVTAMEQVREGLSQRGPLAVLGRTDADFALFNARGGANCTPEAQSTPFIVRASELQAILRDTLPSIGFSGAQATALVDSFDWVDYVAIGRYRTPALMGDPRGDDPDAHWHLDRVAQTQNAADLTTEEVQVWFYVPKARGEFRAPFPVALNAHGYGVGALQTIAFAGYFARQGIATVGINAPAHGLPLTPSQGSALRVLLQGSCMAPFAQAFVKGRSRDLNGDTIPDSGGDFLTAHVFRTRDMFRQTALDYLLLSRIMTESAWSMPGSVDYNGDGRNDAPGDFNGDGTVDLGGQRDGRNTPLYMWGESLGGITSMILGALDPNITAVAPISGGAGLVDVSVRTNITGVIGAVIGPTVGPMLVTVPATERAPRSGRTRTACTGEQSSLRWVVPDANGVGELEVSCLDSSGATPSIRPGDDVVAYNYATRTERCANVRADGKLFLPVAADRGDRIALLVYSGRVVSDYESCARAADAPVRATVTQYTVGEGDCADTCGHVPDNAPDGSPARMQGVRRATNLYAPASGIGLRRQTGGLRRFLQLAQAAIDPADPAAYAPLFYLRSRTPNAHPMLAMTTVGDTLVPVSAGNAFARAAGLIPFIAEPTGTSLDEYAISTDHESRYRMRTPNTVLIENHVIEGLARLERHPVMDHPRYLLDVDDLDEGRQAFGEQVLSPPLRLVRSARAIRAHATNGAPVSVDAARAEIDALWTPPWNQPMAAFLNAYVEPEGTHTFLPSSPDQAFDIGNYLTNLTVHFFETTGGDVPYYTTPMNHLCMANDTCSWITPRPPSP